MISFGTGGWRGHYRRWVYQTQCAEACAGAGAAHEGGGVQDKSFCIGYDRRFFEP